VLREIGSPRFVVSSANGTWIDLAEAAALRDAAAAARRDTAPNRGRPGDSPGIVVSSIYGHVAETFSVGPLAAAAAVLLTGRLPALFGDGPDGHGSRDGCAARATRARGSDGIVAPTDFGVLCTDYAGLVSGCRIGLCERSGARK
jgi:hypothetical protein